MKESYHELVEAIKKSREKCPWAKELEVEKMANELHDEVNEIIKAVENKDNDNLKEEIGDLIMDATHLALLCEEKGLFKAKEVLVGVKEKLVRRKPWVFGDMKVESTEEAVKVWNEIKKKEKELNKNG